MIVRGDLSHLPVGHEQVLGGQLMRHLGGGRFTPAEEPMFKRFAMDEQETLHHHPMAG